MRGSATLIGILVVAGCSSPPRAPTVDESHKRPANTAEAVELQTCKAQASDLRIALRETTTLAENSNAALSKMIFETVNRPRNAIAEAGGAAIGEAARVTLAATAVQAAAKPNTIWTVRFRFNSAAIEPPPAELQKMLEGARRAAWVVVKGRTDGAQEVAGESVIAWRRARTMADLLVASGVERSKIRTEYQPVGDNVESNTTEEGRQQNRRVEIELYAVRPERRAVEESVNPGIRGTVM